jgi:1,4-alpha-glucan branching enzyme
LSGRRGPGGTSGTSSPSSSAAAARPQWLSAEDLQQFADGTNFRVHERFGAHVATLPDGTAGVWFAVWAPRAKAVAVIGEFNDWDAVRDPLTPRGDSGAWERFVPGAAAGQLYKFRVVTSQGDNLDKADPLAGAAEHEPGTASRIWVDAYEWQDDEWMRGRGASNALDAPISIYEIHLGSWRRGDHGELLGYRDLAEPLAEYLTQAGFTHVELMPIAEHPYYPSWGYQATGYFAPTARYGRPEDLMFLIDTLHAHGIGVLLDWVPSHFPEDHHGLARFDGSCVYEHPDPREGHHPDWDSKIFNYSRPEVKCFLVSSAVYWLERFHIDGLRVDAVASMLYRDYSRGAGEWIPNRHGGRENLGAIDLLRALNTEVYRRFPDVQTMAEESTAWPRVSHPVDAGGLGFGLKWDMGWMHDTLRYLARDPLMRSHHHNELSFRQLYAYDENFVLPLSHDEVVHGKGSLLGKMPGDEWQRFANLRLLYGLMIGQPGKKLLFMGAEIAQEREWDHDRELDWDLLDRSANAGVRLLVADLNRLYRKWPALHRTDCDPGGFRWVEADDAASSVLAFIRLAGQNEAPVLVAANLTPVPRLGYSCTVPVGGRWDELLNTDAENYGGSGTGNLGAVDARPAAGPAGAWTLDLNLPPLALVFLAPAAAGDAAADDTAAEDAAAEAKR